MVKWWKNPTRFHYTQSRTVCTRWVLRILFVKLDILKWYYQLPLPLRAQEISAFVTSSGLYRTLMNHVLAVWWGAQCTLMMYSNSWEQHLICICALFERLVTAKHTVNLAKCEFVQATIDYFGKVVGHRQVWPVGAKVLAIVTFPPPTTKEELMRFLGKIEMFV